MKTNKSCPTCLPLAPKAQQTAKIIKEKKKLNRRRSPHLKNNNNKIVARRENKQTNSAIINISYICINIHVNGTI